MNTHKSVLLVFVFCFLFIVQALYSPSDDVVEVSASTFDKIVVGQDGVSVVHFYDPKSVGCKSLSNEFKSVGKLLKGVATVAAVDGSTHKELAAKYKIKGYPSIRVFGYDKANPTPYTEARTAKPIASFALKNIRDLVSARLNGGKPAPAAAPPSSGTAAGAVLELTAAKFEETVMKSKELFLVSFTAPWCGHCKNLKPEWKDAAHQLRSSNGARLANVDCTQNEALCQKFGIRGYPTIKYFKYGAKKGNGSDFNQERKSDAIVNFVRAELARDEPPPEPVELVNNAQLTECAKETACVLAVFPHLYDSSAKERLNYIRQFTAAAAKSRKFPTAFIYTFAGEHKDLEKTVNIGGSGYPAVAILSAAKKAFAPMLSSFSAENVQDFVSDVVTGKESLQKIYTASVPSISSATKWDGKDAVKQEL